MKNIAIFLIPVICCEGLSLLVSKWTLIKTIFDNNAGWIGAVTGVISMILSGFAVYYGRKAYIVAQDIFEKGINLNKERVVEELGLEFVIDIFIPLSKLKKNIEGCYETSDSDPLVSVIYLILKNNRLPNKFVYYETHKSEIWYSLTICENQEKAFGIIRSFVEEVIRFQNILEDSILGLSKYLDKNKSMDLKLNDLSHSSKDAYKRVLYLQETVKKIMEYENMLPKELGITEKKNKINRDYI